MKPGIEIDDDELVFGDYLHPTPDGRYTLLRGRYRGAFVDTVPRGYIRNFILEKCIEDLTRKERQLFELYGKKDADAKS